ncbi:hypothetical protein [Azospirillum argentinense]|uniref:Uncharacterized protein n=1 Tax=Azospirillum brasilense TaxID=192 RepID=A0A4D8Q6A9_AZOBR|nr:hypothetical protein [Azospirillum argentinense]QCO04903.1 hypothetical protein D3867_23920 [Azospirillum argentinense]
MILPFLDIVGLGYAYHQLVREHLDCLGRHFPGSASTCRLEALSKLLRDVGEQELNAAWNSSVRLFTPASFEHVRLRQNEEADTRIGGHAQKEQIGSDLQQFAYRGLSTGVRLPLVEMQATVWRPG